MHNDKRMHLHSELKKDIAASYAYQQIKLNIK